MIRVPSEIDAQQFESLKIQDNTFVAYRSDIYPSKNEVFFEENAVIFVLEGDKIFSNMQREVKVHKGDVLFVKRGFYLMSESINEDYRSLVFFFDEKILKEFTGHHLELFKNVSSDNSQISDGLLKLQSNEVFAKYIESLMPYFRAKSDHLHHFLKLKVQELLLHLLELDASKKLHEILIKIYQGQKSDLEFILHTYALKPLNLEEIARISGRSLSVFKREFALQFGLSPGEYIRSLKLDHAAFLLKSQMSNVEEAAEAVGYASVPHFIKSFKAKYGVTPKKFE
ncbi:MAG: helix-turn-helix transcriptional regulator [Leadbetterella sp.]